MSVALDGPSVAVTAAVTDVNVWLGDLRLDGSGVTCLLSALQQEYNHAWKTSSVGAGLWCGPSKIDLSHERLHRQFRFR